MSDINLSVAISSFNRSRLVGRAIDSVLSQDLSAAEIIIVDDASTDNTEAVITEEYPTIRYFRQVNNRGCCAARNRALAEAKNKWVAILDDDDTLLPGALASIADRIECFAESDKYPVLQFARENGTIPSPFMIARMEDYISGALRGDFVPVIQRELFLSLGFAYPEIRSAGEHLLWWRIAEEYGIPTWAREVCRVHTDAPIRLTSVKNQISHAAEYAQLQELTISEFGHVLSTKYPSYYLSKIIGAATYRLLAGDRVAARAHLRMAFDRKLSGSGLAVWMLSFSPAWLVRMSFMSFRKGSGLFR